MKLCIPLAMLWLLGCAPAISTVPPNLPLDQLRTLWAPCDYQYELPEGPPYKKWPSHNIYQHEMLREMCLSWYSMQQPKNHGILLSRGAPNF